MYKLFNYVSETRRRVDKEVQFHLSHLWRNIPCSYSIEETEEKNDAIITICLFENLTPQNILRNGFLSAQPILKIKTKVCYFDFLCFHLNIFSGVGNQIFNL